MKAVIDTNVLLVANGQHEDISPECVMTCVSRLQQMEKSGVTVIDDGYRILGEYQHKTRLHPPKGVGDVFLKWLLRHIGNPQRVEQVQVNEHEAQEDVFSEFPNHELQARFDAPDRKFVAVANAHPDKPTIWQAADCKWLDWESDLRQQGLHVEFLCVHDAHVFYRKKFPNNPLPIPSV